MQKMSNLKESGVVFETGSINSFFIKKKGGARVPLTSGQG